MKKSIYLLIIITAIFLVGCGKKDLMVNFIPTPIPGEKINEEPTPAGTEETETPAPTQKAVYVGETITKYVKLNEFGDKLNIRPTPSREGKPVGVLKHADKIDVINVADGWASILYNGAICYVNADYLVDEKPEKIEPTTAPSPTMAPTPTSKPATDSTDTTTGKEATPTPVNDNGPEI